jgi:hypothetical protein
MAQGFDLEQKVAPVGITLGLKHLLEGVEVQNEGIGLHQVYGALAVVCLQTGIQLDGAQVGQEQDVGGQVAHAIGVSQMRCLDGGPHRAQTHGYAGSLGSFG